MNRNGGLSLPKFKYNADGIRTSKTVGGIEHVYTLNGTQIVSEAWGDYLLIYLYDESGSPIGMQYRTSSYAADVFDTFYFEKNLQGDIIAIYTESGRKILEYTYDAWGNHSVTWTYLTMETMQAGVNPFRYRGYYYDTDTGLYYLQSRYYNPAWGRFLNADGLLSTGTGLLGYNMYAYCNNNPVSFVDQTGTIPLPFLFATKKWSNNRELTDKAKKIIRNIKADIENYEKDNESEEKVLRSHYFSSYKGVLVVRTPLRRSGSFGIIFLKKSACVSDYYIDEVKHEYGHTLQFEKLGAINYFFSIGIPSVFSLGNKDYYRKPWELHADLLVNSPDPSATRTDINDAWEYFWLCEKLGPLAIKSRLINDKE